MDNASFHKGKLIETLIQDAGHHLLWLPTYSPDLNPIEQCWAWIKAVRRKHRINDIDSLFKNYCDDYFHA
jgi:transposase